MPCLFECTRFDARDVSFDADPEFSSDDERVTFANAERVGHGAPARQVRETRMFLPFFFWHPHLPPSGWLSPHVQAAMGWKGAFGFSRYR